MTITLTKPVRVGGVELAAATTQTFAADVEADLIARGFATAVGLPPGVSAPGANLASDLAAIGAAAGASSITYDSQGRIATHDGWTMNYDTSGKVASQTKSGRTQTFSYDSAGRYTGFVES